MNRIPFCYLYCFILWFCKPLWADLRKNMKCIEMMAARKYLALCILSFPSVLKPFTISFQNSWKPFPFMKDSSMQAHLLKFRLYTKVQPAHISSAHLSTQAPQQSERARGREFLPAHSLQANSLHTCIPLSPTRRHPPRTSLCPDRRVITGQAEPSLLPWPVGRRERAFFLAVLRLGNSSGPQHRNLATRAWKLLLI